MSKTFEVVPFHEHEILTVRQGDEVLVPLKPLVEALGLSWHGQFERVNRHPVLSKGIRVTRIPSHGGLQESVALALEMMPGFLTTIASDRIRNDAIRQRVILFQTEAFQALFAYFFGGRRGAAGAPYLTAGELLRLVDRLKREWQPEIRAMLHALLGQMCDRMSLPLPRIEAFGQPEANDLEIAERFFAGLADLREAGLVFDYHRRPDLLALSLPEIEKLFADRNIESARGPALWQALRQHPAFIGRAPVNGRDEKTRQCWVFTRAKVTGFALA